MDLTNLNHFIALAVKTATIEDVPILKGEHTLSLRCVGKNAASVGTVLGIDYISLKGEMREIFPLEISSGSRWKRFWKIRGQKLFMKASAAGKQRKRCAANAVTQDGSDKNEEQFH